MSSGIRMIVFGDSIGLGVAQAAGLPCDCEKGRQPHEVEAAIAATPPSLIADRDVILSTGLSNNPDGRSHVERQLRLLLNANAARIVVLGVGPGVRAGTNGWLEEIAPYYVRTKFAGPLALPAVGVRMNGDQPGIHPYDYGDVVAQVEAMLS